MSRVFLPRTTEGMEWVLPVDPRENLRFVEEFGRPLAASWRPVPVKFVREGEDRGRKVRRVDMPWMAGDVLVLRPRAALALRDLCLTAGELLPLSCEEEELVAWNVTTVVDAVDHEHFQATYTSDGSLMHVERYEFKADVVDGLTAFRVPETRTAIFVTEEFVTRVKEAGLTGTRFQEVWPTATRTRFPPW